MLRLLTTPLQKTISQRFDIIYIRVPSFHAAQSVRECHLRKRSTESRFQKRIATNATVSHCISAVQICYSVFATKALLELLTLSEACTLY